nr:MAG TPA: LAMBDA REPRESSOR (TRIPLE MUTANT)/DNA COMPLEX-DNA COMPLEX, DOUBLE HELIX, TRANSCRIPTION-DNA.1A [Caudoviricetes sp.]
MNKQEFEIAVKIALIKNEKLNLSKLAKELGISAAYLSDVVRGNRKAEHYRKRICEILDLDYENLNKESEGNK